LRRINLFFDAAFAGVANPQTARPAVIADEFIPKSSRMRRPDYTSLRLCKRLQKS
jgi:hypothetical protein